MEADPTQPSNILKDYSYARFLLKKTSRGKNPDWYREAIRLDHQLHLFPNPLGYEAFLRTPAEEKWLSAPEIPMQINEEQMSNYLNTLRSDFLPRGSRSLGIILHLQKDASVFEFPLPAFEEGGEQEDVRSLIETSPAEVLQDRTLTESQMSFRVFPTPAFPRVEQTGFAVAVSQEGSKLLQSFRAAGDELNFPVRTTGLSSPLLLLSKLPRTIGLQTEPFCVMLTFEEFSFLGFYSESGELILIRSIKHIEGKIPQNLENVISTTAASVELASLQVKVFDCRRRSEISLETELSHLLYIIPFALFQPSGAEEQDVPIELKAWLIEDASPDLAYSETETFGSILSEGYHLQDYLPSTKEELFSIPDSADMKILRVGRLATRVGLVASLALGGVLALSAFTKMRSPDWEVTASVKNEVAKYNQNLEKARLTEQMLGARSKAWVSMELFSRLFPLDGSVQFSSSSHEVVPNSAGRGNQQSSGALGMVKEWRILGYANEQGTKSLTKLESVAEMEKVFEATKEATASNVMQVLGNNRSLTVKLDLSVNSNYSEGALERSPESFPYEFILHITQRIENADPLAIPTGKIQL